jgi:molybdate transport system substrate-binding protein
VLAFRQGVISLNRWFCLALTLLVIGATACVAGGAGRSPGQQAPTITVAAAADLQFAFEEIGARFEEEKGIRVEFSFGSSGNLAQQIENGAPVDVFASANEAYIEGLQAKGLILEDTRQLYALGRIVLVRYRGAGLELGRLEDLLRPEVKHVAIANPDHAPYGLAARQALESAGLWEQVRPKLVYGENVRQALRFVQTGDAEAGIVALSIANVPEVTYVPLDKARYQPLRQTLAVIQGTKHEEAAREFVAYVSGPKGRPIMEKYGFMLPGGH